MKLSNTFTGGLMNTDIDERLLPKGQYPYAQNVRIANTEESDSGALETVFGNKLLTSLNLTNATTVFKLGDSINNKIYWGVHSDEKDMILEYDITTSTMDILLQSSNPDGVLNFTGDKITAINKVLNGDPSKDLMIINDDVNPPRCFNIERVKSFSLDGFIEDDISLIKKPPRFAPEVSLTFDSNANSDNSENVFALFAYRYVYKDNFISALSSFSYYQFQPKNFELDYQTMENKGMINAFNAADITFDTGDERVTDIELVFKKSGENNVYRIERFNKEEEGWGNNQPKTFRFINDKIYTELSTDELGRTFDNVPRKAKAQSLVGNTLFMGNYVEGYDMVDSDGETVKNDYSLEILSKELVLQPLDVTSSGSIANFHFDGVELKKDTLLTFDLRLKEILDGSLASGNYRGNFQFILPKDYVDAQDLATDPTFIDFVETLWSEDFYNNYTNTPPANSIVLSSTDFQIVSSTSTQIDIYTPLITYKVDDTPSNTGDDNFHNELSVWYYDLSETNLYYGDQDSSRSIKSNRSLEIGLVYKDKEGRKSTVETVPDNTVNIPHSLLNSKNSLRVNINHKPPYWADRYKIVVKQNKTDYETIYTNIFYEDGIYRWIKLEGANVDKVKEGDTLIVKSDLGGVVTNLVKVRVLEVDTKEENFLNPDEEGGVKELAGRYMKIKPSGFDMGFSGSTVETFEGASSLRYPVRTYTNPVFDENPPDPSDPLLKAGSTVRVYIKFEANGSIEYEAIYDKDFRVNGNYETVEEWFDAEVGDLGDFGRNYTWDGETYIHNGSDYGYGIGDENNRVSGWGFEDGKFYVMAHRDGTASRDIITTVRFEIVFSKGLVVFETEPKNRDIEIYYETSEDFEIVDGNHQGNVQNQDSVSPAIIDSGFFNCYVFPNGVESYKYKDLYNGNKLDIDTRPNGVSINRYSEERKSTQITWSEPYVENNNLNGLGEFNLSKANFKEDIYKKYGSIQLMYERDTDLTVFQQDKISRVLYRKDLLTNADGSANIVASNNILGQQVTYAGEYGISNNPESFDFEGNNLYFTDLKRGAVLRLGANGVVETSMFGMETYFKDTFNKGIDTPKVGGFDPYHNQYILNMGIEDEVDTLAFSEKVKGWTSYFTFKPEMILGVNNKLYTFYKGNLYQHHRKDVPTPTFYGVKYPSKVSVMVNDSPSDIKLLKAISLEGSKPWNISIKGYISDKKDYSLSTIKDVEFKKKEGIWFAHSRRNERGEQRDSKATYGIGVVTAINGRTLTINGGNILTSVGDTLLDLSLTNVGTIGSIGDGTIGLSHPPVGISVGDYLMGVKNPRVSGGGMRGYTLRMDLDTNVDEKVELFSVNSEVVKSSPF